MPSTRFPYGGQAVIEGVMIRGQRCAAIAVRRPDGTIAIIDRALPRIATGTLRSIPLIRGIIVLIETLGLGINALNYSARVAIGEDHKETSSWMMAFTLLLSLGIGVTLFFLFPLIAVNALDRYFPSSLLSNFVEGSVRLTIFLIYIGLINLVPDIRRVFAYHGAEHMTVHAYEANKKLATPEIRNYSTAHPRCGTAFLLIVMIVAIVVFAFLGRPDMDIRILSRILLIPVIASISYEIIRFSGAHASNQIVHALMKPSLLLQKLTTRQPDDHQIEVAISAMERAMAVDKRESAPSVASSPTRC